MILPDELKYCGLYEELKIRNILFFNCNNRGWKQFIGYGISSRNRYYAYNSFKRIPYLSDLSHVEIFQSKDSANKWMEKYRICGELIMLTSNYSPREYFVKEGH